MSFVKYDFPSQIKSQINMYDVIRKIGFDIDRKKFIKCPFHNERTASLKVYEQSFNCFGCNKGGDLIKFYQEYYNLNFIEAVKQLNNDFNLNVIGLDEKPIIKDKKTIAKIYENKQFAIKNKMKTAELKLLNDKYFFWLQKWIEADKIIINKKPNKPEEITPEFLKAISNIEYYAYMTDCYDSEIYRLENNNNAK